MFVRRQTTGFEIWTPAKVNLTLHVFARREDGFHELETCIVTISLFDTLFFSPTEAEDISITVENVGGYPADFVVPSDDSNLVVRALHRLKETSGCGLGASVRLFKRIPAAAGLGGGSSDAAAALVVANLAWDLGLSRDQMVLVAAEIGSDVASFLVPSPTICRGRGELVEPAAGVGKLHLVIVCPPTGLATAAVYGRLTAGRQPGPTADLPDAANKKVAGRIEVSQNLNNDLQPAAAELSPWIARLAEAFEGLGFLGHQMSGSGTAYFGVCHHAIHAIGLANRLRAMGIGQVYHATTFAGTVSV